MIEEMTKIQTQEELFAFYYEKQKQLENLLEMRNIRHNIKVKQGEAFNLKSGKILQEVLKYTLGIYVSRLSLKKIGPSGIITYTIT